ncbi:unnamed protein product [Zymoseptoria tritici ST99CH_1A5]|uniref:Uncharacterized protein n=1 Tax=Zymoseptoria tritici ST99CH_1A5 TaxID=1276529 RepID=A0A1Y6LYP4_ZYMTR|nr:unnamed protein product [Zymoseptoria tritici ST99CH_1A5]
MFFEETPWFPPGYQLSRSHPLSTPIFNPTAFHKRNERIMAPTVTPRRSTRNKTVSEATVKKVAKVTKSTPATKKAATTKKTPTTKKVTTTKKKPTTKKPTTKKPLPKDQTVAHYASLNVVALPPILLFQHTHNSNIFQKDDTFTHPLAPKPTSTLKNPLPTNNNITHGQSQTATPKKMFPYLYPPLEPDYVPPPLPFLPQTTPLTRSPQEPKWQPMWGTWPTAPKQGPKACTFDKYYFFSFLGDAPRAQRALESLCKSLEESGFGGDVEKANKPLFDARDVLREWTEWRDSIPPDEYSY